jgi:hypothetical protein
MLKDGVNAFERAIIVRDDDIASVDLEPFAAPSAQEPTPFGFAAFRPSGRA